MPGLQNSVQVLDYLGNIGTTDRGDSLRMSASARSLVKLAGVLIETASDNLQKKKAVASGGTISSMKIVNLDLKGPALSLEVQILKTYKFINDGVKGTQGGTGKYQFKNNFAGAKMRRAIERWIRIRGKRGGGYAKKYQPYATKLKTGGKGNIEKKDVKINQIAEGKKIKNAAWAVAISIKKRGIKPTHFFSDAVKETQKQAKKILGEGLKFDIIESLKKL